MTTKSTYMAPQAELVSTEEFMELGFGNATGDSDDYANQNTTFDESEETPVDFDLWEDHNKQNK